MEFLEVNGEQINMGLIQKIDFSPYIVPTKEDADRMLQGEILDWNVIDKEEVPQAQIYVVGRSEPLKTMNPMIIGFLKKLWNERKVYKVEE